MNRNKSPEATAQVDSLNFDSPARSSNILEFFVRSPGDVASQGSPTNAASTTHYEPHLVTGEPVMRKGKKDIRIRGVFRMDPRFDPQCTPITTNGTKKEF